MLSTSSARDRVALAACGATRDRVERVVDGEQAVRREARVRLRGVVYDLAACGRSGRQVGWILGWREVEQGEHAAFDNRGIRVRPGQKLGRTEF